MRLCACVLVYVPVRAQESQGCGDLSEGSDNVSQGLNMKTVWIFYSPSSCCHGESIDPLPLFPWSVCVAHVSVAPDYLGAPGCPYPTSAEPMGRAGSGSSTARENKPNSGLGTPLMSPQLASPGNVTQNYSDSQRPILL